MYFGSVLVKHGHVVVLDASSVHFPRRKKNQISVHAFPGASQKLTKCGSPIQMLKHASLQGSNSSRRSGSSKGQLGRIIFKGEGKAPGGVNVVGPCMVGPLLLLCV